MNKPLHKKGGRKMPAIWALLIYPLLFLFAVFLSLLDKDFIIALIKVLLK